MTIRPSHPESQCTQILALHAKVTERIDRLRAAGFPIHEHLEAASRDLDELDKRTVVNGSAQTILELVLQRTLDAAPGTPRAQNLDGGGGTLRTDEDGHPILRSDPTGDGATQGDLGARDRREILHHLEAIARHLTHYSEFPVEHAKVIRRSADRLVCVSLNWLPRDATDAERHESSDGEPGCEAHAQVRGRKGTDSQGWWQAIVHTWRGGLLGEPAALCTSCHTFAKQVGRKPSADEIVYFESHNYRWPKRHEERKAS